MDRLRTLLRQWPEHQHLTRDLDQLQASWRAGPEGPRRPATQQQQVLTPPRASVGHTPTVQNRLTLTYGLLIFQHCR